MQQQFLPTWARWQPVWHITEWIVDQHVYTWCGITIPQWAMELEEDDFLTHKGRSMVGGKTCANCVLIRDQKAQDAHATAPTR